jgi:hypothetical protein
MAVLIDTTIVTTITASVTTITTTTTTTTSNSRAFLQTPESGSPNVVREW